MAEHVWEMGDWFRKKEVGNAGEIFRFICQDTFDKYSARWIDSGRGFWTYKYSQMEHLPDCDSWTWQPTPKLQLREGAWYERADGKVVGPCKLREKYVDAKWNIGGVWYCDDGSHVHLIEGVGIIREVPAPAPKYRPFARAAEFKPHRDRWIADKNNWAVRVTSLSDKGANGSSWESLVKHWTFEDTGLPCGVEVQS